MNFFRLNKAEALNQALVWMTEVSHQGLKFIREKYSDSFKNHSHNDSNKSSNINNSKSNLKPGHILLPNDSHCSELKIISGISFTDKEINLIACLLSGKTIQEIAPLLQKAPKTEIAVKTLWNCSSSIAKKLRDAKQGKIIHFIEKSDKFLIIKQHYTNLLIRHSFRRILQENMLPLSKTEAPYCLILYNGEQAINQYFANELKNDILFAGMTACVEDMEKFKDIKHLNNKIVSQKIDYAIFCLSSEIIKKPREKLSPLIQEIVYARQTIPDTKNKFIFLQIEKTINIEIEQRFTVSTIKPSESIESLEYIDAKAYDNYFLFVFEILKKLLPSASASVHDIAEVFQKKYQMLARTVPEMPESKKGSSGNINGTLTKSKSLLYFLRNKMKQPLLSFLVFSVIILSIVFYHFIINTKTNAITDAETGSRTNANISTGANSGTSTNADTKTWHWNLPRQDHTFIGRKDLLDELHHQLHGNHHFSLFPWNKDIALETKTLAISACTGLGGIGKTQLALQYIHHNSFPYTLRAWFPAENLDQLRQKYIEFAKTLGYKTEETKIEPVIAYVKEWLSKHPGWLLVYDNVENYKDIAPFLPEQGGHVILTSRYRVWPEKFLILPIDIMPESDAMLLIESLTKPFKDEPEKILAKELVKTLGYLPLAIAQAGSYIKQTHSSIREYLEIYQKYAQTLLEDTTLPQGSYSLPTAVTWNISLDSIAKDTETEPLLVHELLTICAYLTPERIPRKMLLTWLQKAHSELPLPEIKINKLLQILWQYSMVNFDGDDCISIHRLVQSILRHQHQQKDGEKYLLGKSLTLEWYQKLLENIHYCTHRELQKVEEEYFQKQLLPHLNSLVTHYTELWPRNFGIEYSEILHDIGYINFYYLGNSKLAEDYLNHALEIKLQHYGTNHPEIAILLTNLGGVNTELGNIKEAKNNLELSLEITERHYGKNHLETAKVLNHLSDAYRGVADPKKAIEVSKRALSIKKLHCPSNDFEISFSQNALGIAYNDFGEPKNARVLLEEVLRIREQHYEKNHFRIASILTNLGNTYNNLGDYQHAKNLLERALKIRQDLYGNHHFLTAITLNHLAINYRNIGRLQNARELLQQVLFIRENHYGKNHPITANTLTHLGMVYKDLGDRKEAYELLNRSLKICEEYYNQDHHEVALSLQALGEAYVDWGNPREAKELLARAFKSQQSYYGDNHLEVAKTLFNLAKASYMLQEFKEAHTFAKKIYPIFVSHYSENHPDTKQVLKLLNNDQK